MRILLKIMQLDNTSVNTFKVIQKHNKNNLIIEVWNC